MAEKQNFIMMNVKPKMPDINPDSRRFFIMSRKTKYSMKELISKVEEYASSRKVSTIRITRDALEYYFTHVPICSHDKVFESGNTGCWICRTCGDTGTDFTGTVLSEFEKLLYTKNRIFDEAYEKKIPFREYFKEKWTSQDTVTPSQDAGLQNNTTD